MEREESAQDKLIALLASHQAIGIDTSVFLHHFEASQRYLPLTTALLSHDILCALRYTAQCRPRSVPGVALHSTALPERTPQR